MADALEAGEQRLTSPIAIFEAALAVRRKRHATVAEAHADVQDLLQTAAIATVAATPAMAEFALETFARYGKRQGHPAQLNMGDCFAYAGLKTHRTSLLFKGFDFTLTDARPAAPG